MPVTVFLVCLSACNITAVQAEVVALLLYEAHFAPGSSSVCLSVLLLSVT